MTIEMCSIQQEENLRNYIFKEIIVETNDILWDFCGSMYYALHCYIVKSELYFRLVSFVIIYNLAAKRSFK